MTRVQKVFTPPLFLIPLSVASMALAAPIRVSFGDHRFDLNLTSDFITFREPGFAKHIKKQKCNRALVDQFAADLKTNQKRLPSMTRAVASINTIKIATEGKSSFAFKFNDEGRFFANLPSKFKNLWLTSVRQCGR